MSPCAPNRTSGRKCRVRTPDAIQSMVGNTRLSCPAYPRRQPRLSVWHRLKVAVSVVLSALNPKTTAGNGFCSVTLRETTRWNLIQFGSTAQPNPPFPGTNRPCQAQAARIITARPPWKLIWHHPCRSGFGRGSMGRREALRTQSSPAGACGAHPLLSFRQWPVGTLGFPTPNGLATGLTRRSMLSSKAHGEALLQPWPATAKYAHGAQPALPQVNPWT